MTGFFAALVLFAGFGSQDAFARCGKGNSGIAWKYASTAELIRWDGRWRVDPSGGSEPLVESHADPDTIPCSHCGGRPTDEIPEPTPVPLVRVDSQTLVFASQALLTDPSTPPLHGMFLLNEFLPSRTLEVSKRPPKDLLMVTV
jgi:hypothetical protein